MFSICCTLISFTKQDQDVGQHAHLVLMPHHQEVGGRGHGAEVHAVGGIAAALPLQDHPQGLVGHRLLGLVGARTDVVRAVDAALLQQGMRPGAALGAGLVAEHVQAGAQAALLHGPEQGFLVHHRTACRVHEDGPGAQGLQDGAADQALGGGLRLQCTVRMSACRATSTPPSAKRTPMAWALAGVKLGEVATTSMSKAKARLATS